MRSSIRRFVEIAADTISIQEPIYEFGSFQAKGRETLVDLRPIFASKKYIGCDIRNGPGVDMILDLHSIDLPDNSVGTVLILDVLEHVTNPFKAMDEIRRILKNDGLVIMSSVMNWPIHNHPKDYWRFTPEAFRILLVPFDKAFSCFVGDSSFPQTVAGVGVKGDDISLEEFIPAAQSWKRSLSGPRWKTAIKQLIPPIILSVYNKLRWG